MPKVLIIEDRRENIVFIANNILRPMGYDVITARDGQSGLEKATTESPDLIITDLKLPRMNGLEVLEQLNEQGLHIPAIVMTFHGTEATAVKALRLGARDYLIKPFTMEEMQAALDRALNPNNGAPQAGEASGDAQARVAALEAELKKTKTLLAERENQLGQLRHKVSQYINKSQMARALEQASMWEKDNARLNQMLVQAKEAVNKAEGRADALKEAMIVQQTQLNKYKKEARRLADELRNLSEAIRLMSQDMEHQMNRLTTLTPQQQ